MSDFNDRPLVVGSVLGLRSFAVDSLGRLTGVTIHKVWTPGENVAECSGSCTGGIVSPAAMRKALRNALISYPSTFTSTTYLTSESSTNTAPEDSPASQSPQQHTLGGLGNNCGFWAFFDGSNDYHTSGENVAAIVEGYGTVTVGTRGFRAEKARIAALIIPEPPSKRPGLRAQWRAFARWTDRRDGLVIPAAVTAFVGGGLLAGASGSVGNHWLMALGILLLLCGATTAVATFKGLDYSYDDRRTGTRPLVDYSRVRHNYADVPVFPTVEAALRAYPVQHPDPPKPATPETDPDFWTRSAS